MWIRSFLGLLNAAGRVRYGIGFDANRNAIAYANYAKRQWTNHASLEFIHLDVTATWPAETFDVVTMIDVMHHIPVDEQRATVKLLASYVRPGGVLLYKDMVRRPRWRAWANRLHDLVLARDWIHYAAVEDIERWATEYGLVLKHSEERNMLWYGHEIRLFDRPTTNNDVNQS